jgi:hypothetical protein
MKRLAWSLTLTLLLVGALTGCGGTPATTAAASVESTTTAVSPTTTTMATPTTSASLATTTTAQVATTTVAYAVPAAEEAKAKESFAEGYAVYLYDVQPATVRAAEIDQTVFSYRYVVEDGFAGLPNVLGFTRLDSAGHSEYGASGDGFINDWAGPSGRLEFTLFNMFREVNRQQKVTDPNAGIMYGYVGMTPLYGPVNQYYVDDPAYIEILLVAPEQVEDAFLFTEAAKKLSNTVRIAVSQ